MRDPDGSRDDEGGPDEADGRLDEEAGRPDDVLVPPPERRRRSWRNDSSLFTGTLVTALLVAGAVGAWLWLTSGDGSDAAGPAGDTLAPPAAAGDTSAATAADSALDLPPLTASDDFLRRVAAGLSERPGWTRWLATDDLVRDFVASVVQISAGSSPAERLRFLEPEEPFQVREVDGRTVIDPASFRRYDLPAAIVVSLDTEGTARLYRQLLPLFQEAHQELGFQEGTFDQAFADAVRTLLAVEVPDGPVEVVRDEGVYRFRDSELESLSPPAKHLIRMGPDNARRVQGKLREVADAIGIRVEEGGTASP